jgi:hypothetical protein
VKIFKYAWLLIAIVQIISSFVFFNDLSKYGIYNTDAFSYHLHWAKTSQTLNPFSDPVLADPNTDVVRILFSMPHTILGFTSKLIGPLAAYLAWTCIGAVLLYFSLVLFARSIGFDQDSYFVAFVHYTFFHLLSQLPPLSTEQVKFVIDAFSLKPETFAHFGPRQYPHDIFFYPLLFSVLGLTIVGARKIFNHEKISSYHLVVWVVLCCLFPFNYLYHWFQFAFALFFVIAAGFMLKWWSISRIQQQYTGVLFSIITITVVWGAVIVFQTIQLQTEHGYRFALMGGQTEARFVLLPFGLLVRIIFWSALLWFFIRLQPRSVILIGFLIGCLCLMNMQLITGKNIQPGHWSFGIDRIFGWIFIICAASLSKKYIVDYHQKARAAIGIICILFFIGQSFKSWEDFSSKSQWDDERAQLIEFMNKLPKAVVLVPEIWLETDILIHTKHQGFLGRGAQSAIELKEQMERIAHAALVLNYSKEGLISWLHIRSVRFFGMLYGIEKEFSSSFYYDPAQREEIFKFRGGSLTAWDNEMIDNYLTKKGNIDKQLDYVVLHTCEVDRDYFEDLVFENRKYSVFRAKNLGIKMWGTHFPINEMKYPLYQAECQTRK